MFKSFIVFAVLCSAFIPSFSFAGCGSNGCCQSLELGVGWRRDELDWKLTDLKSCYVSANVDSHIKFKDVNLYTVYGKAKWVGSAFYVRLSADYGQNFKGNAKQCFQISSPYFYDDYISVQTKDPVKRRSEVFDFNGAVGYPFATNCGRLNIVPLIGFSYHRQRLRVKEPCTSFCDCNCCGSSTSSIDTYSSCSSSSSSFQIASSTYTSSSCYASYWENPLDDDIHSNPFSSPSSYQIAHDIGLNTHKRISSYRFTWYGFYLGADIAYALDSCWTLYGEFEGHFLNRCHRKRNSITGVYFVDDYHKEGWAYGFNGSIGTTIGLSNCWYATFSVDYKWWNGHSKHDHLDWQSVGVNAALAYSF